MKITPMEALKLATSAIGNTSKAKDFLLIWLSAGQIKADAAVTKKANSATVIDKKIASPAWSKFKTTCPHSLWETGTATYQAEEYVGIRFDKAQVEQIIDAHAPKSSGTPGPTNKNSGRSSGFHGEAVGVVTAHYLLADDATYRSASVRSISDALAIEYKRLGAPPPSVRNLGSMANGILKVLGQNR